MAKKQKIILIGGLVIITLGGLIIWGLSRSPEKDLLQEAPNLPESGWSRAIAVSEAKPGYKIVTNKFDGYEIAVPFDWTAPEIATIGGYGIAHDNLNLNIFVMKEIKEAEFIFPESARFMELEMPAGKAYRTVNKIPGEDVIQNGKNINPPIENSLSIGYIFPSEEKVFIVLCSAVGDAFEERVNFCEKQISTFKIIK